MSDTPEYKQLVGQGTAGDFVKETQGVASDKGFSHISKFWYPKTISYEQAIDNITKERENRRDIESLWSEWKFTPKGKKIILSHPDEGEFELTDHAMTLAMTYCGITTTHLNSIYLSPKDAPDGTDLEQLCDTLNHRKKRFDYTNKEEPRELVFRAYSDNTIRAVVTPDYTPIDNVWFLEVLRDLIPNGRLSHQRGDADTMYANVLLPDDVRDENDGQYGGMFSIRNSEIRVTSLDTMPSLFRAVCRNGLIHSQTKGVRFRQVHRGEIVLETLALEIKDNLDKQIKMLPEIMDRFLALRQNEFKNVDITQVLAQVAKDGGMSGEQGKAMLMEWDKNENRIKTPFAVINAVTRMSQQFDAATCNKFDIYGGDLISSNWEKITFNAKDLKKEQVLKILGLNTAV